MPIATLFLQALDIRDSAHWYWRLHDANGAFLADHTVALDPADWRYEAFCDLHGYLDRRPDRASSILPAASRFAEAGRRRAGEIFQTAVDTELAAYWRAVFDHAEQQEMQGAGGRPAGGGSGASVDCGINPFPNRFGHVAVNAASTG